MEQEVETLRNQLQKQEKLASLGLLSAGIAHEIQNPLNFVINFSKMSDKLLKDLKEIVEDNEDKLSDDDREGRLSKTTKTNSLTTTARRWRTSSLTCARTSTRLLSMVSVPSASSRVSCSCQEARSQNSCLPTSARL